MLGSGKMDEKFSPRVSAYGEVDEANATIGLAVAIIKEGNDHNADALIKELVSIQNDLFDVGADLCVPIDPDEKPGERLRIAEPMVASIEQAIDRWNAQLDPLASFVLPGGTKASAAIHVARTVTRRAERAVTFLLSTEPETTNRQAQVYLNRLSDYLFVIARIANDSAKQDVLWKPGGKPGAD